MSIILSKNKSWEGQLPVPNSPMRQSGLRPALLQPYNDEATYVYVTINSYIHNNNEHVPTIQLCCCFSGCVYNRVDLFESVAKITVYWYCIFMDGHYGCVVVS